MKKYNCCVILILVCLFNHLTVSGQNLKPLPVAESINSAASSSNPVDGLYPEACKVCDNSKNTKADGKAADVSEKTYEIDARPGYENSYMGPNGEKIYVQQVSFKRGSRVHVFIRNLNPFLFEYEILVNEKPIVETEHLKFLKFFSSLFTDFLPSEGEDKRNERAGDERESPEKAEKAEKGKACHENAPKKIKQWKAKLDAIDTGLMANRKSIDDDNARFLLVAKAYARASKRLYHNQALCKDLCDEGNRFLANYLIPFPEKFQLEELKEEIAEQQEAASDISGEIEEYLGTHGDCAAKTEKYDESIIELSERAQALISYANKTLKQHKKLTFLLCMNQTKFDSMKDSIEYVLRYPESLLSQELVIGQYSQSTDVDITIRKTEIKQPKGKALTECDPDKNKSSDDDEPPPSSARHRNSTINSEPERASSSLPTDRSGVGIRSAQFATVNYPLNQETKNKAAKGAANGSSTSGRQQENDQPDQQTPPASTTQADPKISESERTLEFGKGARFSISGGIAFSPLKRRQFQNVIGFELDRQGNMINPGVLTNVITEEESSDIRLGPMVMLNTRLLDNSDLFHLSFGVTGKHDNNGTDIEYLFGPSLSLLERKLFLTGGVYLGKQQKLAGDLYTGLKIDPTLAAIPINKEFRAHFGFALTYRISDIRRPRR